MKIDLRPLRELIGSFAVLLAACSASQERGASSGPATAVAAPAPPSSTAKSAEVAFRTGTQEPAVQEAPVEERLTSAEALAAFDEAWQTIHDTHFDPSFNGVDWDAVKTELRPRVERAATREEVRAVIAEMLGRLHQSHFVVIPSEALPDAGVPDGPTRDQSGSLGFDVRLRDGRLLVTEVDTGGAAEAAGVQRGWIVRSIGAFDAERAAGRLAESGGALGERKSGLHMWSAARAVILGAVGGSERVSFLDGADHETELDLARRKRDVTVHNFGTNLPTFYLEFRSSILERGGKRIGTLSFSNWFLPMMQPLNEAIDRMRGVDGIVLDLRGNTGGAAAMTMGVAGNFFAETRKLGVMTTRDTTINILAVPRLTDSAGARVVPFAGPMAIVTDETTGSASEVFAGGMQSVGRVRVFGETTAGAVLPAMTTRLPNGDTLLHAMGDFETATGSRLEGTGVVPDSTVRLQRSELLAGHDSQLEAAIAWLVSQEQ